MKTKQKLKELSEETLFNTVFENEVKGMMKDLQYKIKLLYLNF